MPPSPPLGGSATTHLINRNRPANNHHAYGPERGHVRQFPMGPALGNCCEDSKFSIHHFLKTYHVSLMLFLNNGRLCTGVISIETWQAVHYTVTGGKLSHIDCEKPGVAMQAGVRNNMGATT